jgi:hypothetical protein
MKLNTRLAFLAGLVAAGLLAGCGGDKTNTDGGTKTDAGQSESCLDDTDCPDTSLFFCNTLTSKCEAACRVKDDCGAAKRGEYALDYCSGNLGCQCDEGKCVASLCSTDADCGSLACRNGSCVPAPAASGATKCQLTPDYVVAPAGTPVKFWVSAWSGTDPLVAKDGFTWTPAPTSGATGGSSATVTLAAGTTSVQVSVGGGVSCSATVTVLPAVTSGLRATVTDELTGRPVTGTKVVLSDSAGATLDTQTVGVDGTASFGSASGTVTVTAFNAGYNYLTIANYDMAAAGASKDLSLVIRRNQTDKYGGYKGTFKNVPATPNIKLGIASASLAGSVTDLSLTQLLGPTEPTDVKIGTILDQKDVPLPAGVFLAYDVNSIKPNVSAQGLAGVCTKADGTADEDAIATGSCGTRSAWAVAGDVPLSELSGAASSLTGGLSGINFGQLLSQLLPVFRRFNSSVVRDVQFTLKDSPKDNGGRADFNAVTPSQLVADFSTADHDFQQIPLGFNFAVKFGNLPSFKGAPVDGLILLGGAIVPGRGVVPLGLGVGVNSNGDAQVDKQGQFPSAGLVGLRMAPAHHGLEGSTYGIVALGASLKSATDSTAGVGGSALFARIPENKLVFDPKGATPVDLSGQSFLTIPEGAKYNFVNSTYQGIPGRSFRFTTAPNLAGASVLRITFYGYDEKRWMVLANPADFATTSGGFTLPVLPSGIAQDRTFQRGSSTGERGDFTVQTVKLQTEAGADLSFKNLVENNGTNADRMNDFARAFAIYGYARPEVKWETPTSGGTASVGSTFKLTVANFRIGTDAATADGTVEVSCGQGANTSVTVSAWSDQEKGEITGVLPSGCTAGAQTLTATLLDTQGQPLQPAAAFTNAVTLQ